MVAPETQIRRPVAAPSGQLHLKLQIPTVAAHKEDRNGTGAV